MFSKIKRIWHNSPPDLTEADAKCAERVVTLVKENLGAVPTDEEAIRELLNDPNFEQAVALEIADWREMSQYVRAINAGGRFVIISTLCVISAMIAARLCLLLL